MASTYSTAFGRASQLYNLGTHRETGPATEGSNFEYRVWRPSRRLTPNSLISQPGCKRFSSRTFPTLSKTRRVGSRVQATIAASAALLERVDAQSGNPATPTFAEQARTLVEISDEGTLGTVGEDGWPIGTHVRFALPEDGNPVLLLHLRAIHTGHVEADARCTLHVQVLLPGGHKPQVTLKGHIRRPPEGDVKALTAMRTAWERKYGEESDEAQIYRLDVEKVLYAPDIGVEELWVPGQDYLAATADPLRDCAPAIVEDMNQLMFEDIQRFPRVLAGADKDIDVARITWVDRLGFNLQVLYHEPKQLEELRVAFPREVVDERDARSSLTMLAQLSDERQRVYPSLGKGETVRASGDNTRGSWFIANIEGRVLDSHIRPPSLYGGPIRLASPLQRSIHSISPSLSIDSRDKVETQSREAVLELTSHGRQCWSS
ncbi:hypothetical protein KFL_000280230 [Klebsormidium nitens]|uniref:DUF2470 domain-containing protein n=1 Tax=Klebsormidium nitens TaxID=105231 RepID=A0A1Y1HU01_KLENI|nr:hypothetical protein KFL_000280230 [Klebsormidium nitens]|eukprot:GAQ79318.1 hypothetical protein KFL_000280230 [Klebsormidium nitens]